MRITITNASLGTSVQTNFPKDGIFSTWQERRIRQGLKAPPGLPGAGPLGEEGPQRPPETPGWEYTFERQDDGRVKATPHPISEGARA
jgi:hypothetical protein